MIPLDIMSEMHAVYLAIASLFGLVLSAYFIVAICEFTANYGIEDIYNFTLNYRRVKVYFYYYMVIIMM